MKFMLIKDLPQYYRDLAIERSKTYDEKCQIHRSVRDIGDTNITASFTFSETPEGGYFWGKVAVGNFNELPDWEIYMKKKTLKFRFKITDLSSPF